MTGLVLAGGGVKGSYQIGSYLAFKACGIKVNGVVGTSIGSFNAALIVSGMEKELYDFWKNVNVGELLHFNSKYVDSVNSKEFFKEFIYGIEEIGAIIKNKGIKNDNLKKILNEMIDEKKIRTSKMDYGLVTLRVNDLKPLYLFKEDMKPGKIAEYILASCNLPLFKLEKFFDGNLYVDGGFYDNNPVNMLLDKGYTKVYSVEIQGIGFTRKIKDKSKVIRISPSRFLGSTLNVNQRQINENIKLGYYDTLKILRKYKGYNFIFKNKHKMLYNILVRQENKELVRKVQTYFNVSNNQDLVIKAVEYVMLKEDMTYFKVYNILDVIKKIKKLKHRHFIYDFVRDLKIF